MTRRLDAKELQKVLKSKANTIVCIEISNEIIIPNNIQVINADKYRIEGTWEIYRFNQKIVNKLINCFSSSFKISGFKIHKALNKTLYWTNNKIGSLQLAYNQINEPKQIINANNFYSGNFTLEIIKFLHITFKNNYKALNNREASIKNFKEAKIGVLVNDEFELNLYLDLLNIISIDEDIILFHYGNISNSLINKLPEKVISINLSELKSYKFQSLFNPFKLNTIELKSLNFILAEWGNFSNEIYRYKYIKSLGIKKLLVNVAENMAVRNLMVEVFQSQIVVYNTMNGLKGGEAQDADIYFDYWFVWDSDMKEMMIKKCNIPEKKLIVSGHLTKDKLLNWVYKESLKLNLDELHSKKVISFFSNRGFRKEKVDALKMLYEFMEMNLDYFLIVRPHPLEKENEYIKPDKNLKNVFFVPDEFKISKEALFDQLYLTDLSIVMGSTVALESAWMGVESLSLEYKQESIIYNSDSNKIKHVKNIQELLNIISVVQKKKHQNIDTGIPVSKIIATELLS